ncbi:hypothetical protein EYC80_009094 [Monilinia laxa]|uniref:Uncharacterized protein n=1 Tax=Monilinia laxa TaxID=61186 RepID=A0A5N6K2E0_MONLA|nr:hypothetical protein EYC80_009094 [Monilinia laxa]
MPVPPCPRNTAQSSQPNILTTEQLQTKSFLEGYLPSYESIKYLSDNTKQPHSSKKNVGKLRALLGATESVSLCLSQEQSGSLQSPPLTICDATQDLLANCTQMDLPSICCFSDALPTDANMSMLVYVIRCLVAQLYFQNIQSGGNFTSPNFSEIKTELGTMQRGIVFIGQLLDLQTKPCIVIIDNFEALYKRSLKEPRHDDGDWTEIFRVLQRQGRYTSSNPKPPVVKLFVTPLVQDIAILNMSQMLCKKKPSSYMSDVIYTVTRARNVERNSS